MLSARFGRIDSLSPTTAPIASNPKQIKNIVLVLFISQSFLHIMDVDADFGFMFLCAFRLLFLTASYEFFRWKFNELDTIVDCVHVIRLLLRLLWDGLNLKRFESFGGKKPLFFSSLDFLFRLCSFLFFFASVLQFLLLFFFTSIFTLAYEHRVKHNLKNIIQQMQTFTQTATFFIYFFFDVSLFP